jgi:hypothetical protein
MLAQMDAANRSVTSYSIMTKPTTLAVLPPTISVGN